MVESGLAWQTMHLSGNTGFWSFGKVMSVESGMVQVGVGAGVVDEWIGGSMEGGGVLGCWTRVAAGR